jgi:hypothetical protein
MCMARARPMGPESHEGNAPGSLARTRYLRADEAARTASTGRCATPHARYLNQMRW